VSTGTPTSGRIRAKKTTWRVRCAEVVSRALITVGGIGTILSVLTVFIFLLWVALPLVRRAAVAERAAVPLPVPTAAPLGIGLDEYGLMGWVLQADGRLLNLDLRDGAVLEHRELLTGTRVTALSQALDSDSVAVGLADGAVRFGRIGFGTEFIEADAAPAAWQGLSAGAVLREGATLVQRLSESQFRRRRLEVVLDDPLPLSPGAAIVLLDHLDGPSGRLCAAWSQDGQARLAQITERRNILTGKTTRNRREAVLTVPPRDGLGAPAFLVLSGLGDTVSLAWSDGHLVRCSTRDLSAPAVLEEVDLLGDPPGRRLTRLQPLLGGTTLLAGDSGGRVRAWFPVWADGAGPAASSTRLVAAHTLPGPAAPVASLASSARTRLVAVGYADGSTRLFHVTSQKELARLDAFTGSPVQALALAPKDDAIAALSASQARLWSLDPRHPEASLRALLGPVWYEGATGPAHVWQSTSGTDDFEPKFGLVPLIFGTIKATVFSMVLAVPIALLAALFTSEFLPPRARQWIKPTVELMASLPSVVLGFLAALVIAPVVTDRLPTVLAAFYALPLSCLLGAYAWQTLPRRLGLRLSRWRFLFIGASLPLGALLAHLSGPWLERACFAGDLKRWLDGQVGDPVGGWFYLLLGPSCAVVAWPLGRALGAWVRAHAAQRGRGTAALLDLCRFLAVLAAGAALALMGAELLEALGFDPRRSILGTYVQRNALVVGFVMGFAIIPIIYTIAEDALAAVPEHLRSASLGCGATPWQTAMRLVVPTAMSGLFSAVMVGLGRAVGETMIVLMAAGNTPVLEWNIFNGFRTLSANLAVELPEAVRDSTHYRTLFLAALVLFLMTFVINTIAERIRAGFREKAGHL